MSKSRLVVFIILLVLLLDQILKIWVKTHMIIGEEHHILGNWFIIHFTENNGMAFGLEFAGKVGKYLLSVFRVVAVIFIAFYISRLLKKKVPIGYIIAIGLIFAGAAGNIIDSVFYGLIFDHSFYQVAQFMPQGGGYAGVLQGRVVDMLYFPIIKGSLPSWSPINPSEPFVFFSPVFNLADTAITTGMFMIILFFRKTLKNEL